LDPPNPDPRSSKHDPLKWLDDGLLTGLLTVAQSHFLLEEIFDVFHYFKILTDSPSNLSAVAIVNHKDRVISAILSSAWNQWTKLCDYVYKQDMSVLICSELNSNSH